MTNKPDVLTVIPARYGSTRLAGKPLKTIGGKPMIQLVYERALKIKRSGKVVVATDDTRIYDAVTAFGAEARMTSPEHHSGTDRVAEVAGEEDAEIIINLQGDEPFIKPDGIDEAVGRLVDDPAIEVATLCVAVGEKEAQNPDVTMVVKDLEGMALYFSKLPIPNDRDGQGKTRPLYKHLGIYVFRRDFLIQYAALEPTPLERSEKLEQLRILEHGHRILCVETADDSIGVDSPDDLQRASEIFRREIIDNGA